MRDHADEALAKQGQSGGRASASLSARESGVTLGVHLPRQAAVGTSWTDALLTSSPSVILAGTIRKESCPRKDNSVFLTEWVPTLRIS